MRKGSSNRFWRNLNLSAKTSELKFFTLRFVARRPKLVSFFSRSAARSSPQPALNQSAAARRRRFILLLCLSVGSLLLVGLIRQPIEQVPESISTVTQSVQDSIKQSFQQGILGPKTARVGLQVGHLNPEAQPDELAKLRFNTGGYAKGIQELDINYATAAVLKDMLQNEGVQVDILPAVIPPNYQADLLISLHADSSPDANRRGYKSAHFRYPRNKWEPVLKTHLDDAYFYFSGLPDDDENVSGSMLEYYAFNRAQYSHTVSRSTPAVIVEMGYISNEEDLSFISDPVNPAYALKRGILTYLSERGRFKLSE